jgi:GNAT superfamily N-acetyltransferase
MSYATMSTDHLAEGVVELKQIDATPPGTGYGTRLMDEIIHFYRHELRAKRIVAFVSHSYPSVALSKRLRTTFYPKFGFVVAAHRDGGTFFELRL